MTRPAWAEALETAFTKNPGAGFEWLPKERADLVPDMLVQGLDLAPYGDEFQEEGRARIRRSVALALGPVRRRRLTDEDRPMVLLFDPEVPDRLFATLGTQFPPQLWPSAEPTLEGVLRDLGPYLSGAWPTRASFARTLRVQRSTLTALGVDSIHAFASIMARFEPWLDARATWANASDDDPWPDDPSKHSMIGLRVVSERAQETRRDRRESVTMRTLWSRSYVTIEEGPYESVVVEFRYEPAPFVANLAAGDGRLLVPEDLPADLLASLIRSGTTTPASLSKAHAELGLTPEVAVAWATLAPGESTTHARLRELVASSEDRTNAAGIAADLGARGLVYRAALATEDAEEREKLLSWVAMTPPGAPTDDGEDALDEEDEGDDDDWDDDDLGEEDDLGDDEDEVES